MSTPLRTLLVLLFIAILSACVTNRSQPEKSPEYLNANKGCVVLVGGAVGSQFTDPQVSALWTKVNSAVTKEIFDRIALDKYRAVKLVISTEQEKDSEHLIVNTLAKNQCSRLLQVSHDVNEDNFGKYFRFEVSLLRMDPKGERKPDASGTPVITVGEYLRSYRFPRTQQSFDSFYTGTFAENVLADLKSSGALKPIEKLAD